MGGFVENPELPEAVDVPPENAFDIQSFVEAGIDTLKKYGVVGAEGSVSTKLEPGWALKEILAFLQLTPEILQKILEGVGGMATPLLTALVKVATGLLKPGMNVLGTLTHEYVMQMTGQGLEKSPAGLPVPGGPARDATSVVFDQIMAPLLGLLTPSSPGESGAGEKNAQHVLGTIISLHLSTWMVNIISNLTGLGVLKWINSFDDAITSGISARGFSRLATRPYLNTFVVAPATRDLNVRYPLNVGSSSNLLKGYLRGALSREELIRKMRGLGFAEEVVEDLLLDTAKLLSVEAVVWLVNQGTWTEAQATEHLEQAGWPKELAPVVFQLERTSLVRSQMRTLANSLVTAFQDRRIDNPTLRYLLGKMDLSQDEINAFVTRGAVLQEIPQRLTFAQVRSLYQESLVDFSYVERFLRDEGYSDEDVDLLVLLEFTRKEEREARIAYQLEQRRIREEAQAKKERDALAKQQAELLSLG